MLRNMFEKSPSTFKEKSLIVNYIFSVNCEKAHVFKAPKANDPRAKKTAAPKAYFKHPDPECYWQCAEGGQTFARPCAKLTTFDEKHQVCV